MKRAVCVALMGLFVAVSRSVARSPASLTLAQCVEIALKSSPDVAAARALVDAAAEGVKMSHAGYLPQISAGMSYTRQTYNYAASPGTTPEQWRLFYHGESLATSPYYYGGLNLSQTLLDFGRTKGAVETSQAQLQAAKHNLIFVRDQVDYNVQTAYFTTIAARETVDVQQASLDNAQKHLEQSVAFHSNGMVPGIDVTSSQLAVANAKLGLAQAQENLKVSRAQLATYMGIPVGQAPEPASSLENAAPQPSFNQLLQEADENRADLLAQLDQIKAAMGNELTAKGATRPYISLDAFFDFRNLTWPLIYNWSLGQLLAQSIFSGGANTARLRQTQAQEVAARESVDSLRLQVQQQVFAALSSLKVTHEQVITAQEADRFARANLALAEGRYKVGVGNIVELDDAQTQATNAAVQLVATRYDYQVARVKLDFVLGRGPK